MYKPLPNESVIKNGDIATVDELQQLHAQGSIGLTSLQVRNEGIDFNLLAGILRSNATTLKILCINHGDDDKKCSTDDSFQNFTSALTSCVNLDSFALNGFRKELRNYSCNFVTALFRLPRLRVLCLTNTYLGDWGRQFFVGLRDNSTIKELHLVHALDRTMWQWYFHLLGDNSTLEKLVLGNSAIKLGYLQSLITVVTSLPSLKSLDWTPDGFYKNKAYYWINEYPNFSEIYRKHVMGESLADLVASDKVKYEQELSEHNQACQLLQEVQKFINERNGTRKMEVIIELPDERSVDFTLIGSTALLHSAVLQNLTIRMSTIEKNAPFTSAQQFEVFLNMLGQCQRLRSLKIETFQNTFTPTMLKALFKVLETLPLETLSFNKTFIGPVGVECLISLCKQNKLVEVDFTLIGLIHKKSVEDLSRCIKTTTSLRTIMLGKSPLTLTWWQILSDAAASNRSHPELQWQVTNEEAMKGKMKVLCMALHYDEEARYYARDITFEQFCAEIVNIEQRYQQLPNSTPQSGATGNGFEMQPVRAAEEFTGLLSSRPKSSYGAVNGARAPK